MKSLSMQFLDFARSKPREEVYDFGDSRECACGQFVLSLGMDWWKDRDQFAAARWGLEDRFSDELFDEPRTFSALADRLEASLGAGQ